MQDYFTKWVEGRAICDKEVLTIDDPVVQDWILKNGTPGTLHSNRGKEFIAVLHQEVVIFSTLLRRTLQCTAHRPMVWWNAVTVRCWPCSEL